MKALIGLVLLGTKIVTCAGDGHEPRLTIGTKPRFRRTHSKPLFSKPPQQTEGFASPARMPGFCTMILYLLSIFPVFYRPLLRLRRPTLYPIELRGRRWMRLYAPVRHFQRGLGSPMHRCALARILRARNGKQSPSGF